MATLEEIGRALKNAHAAGDTAAAQKLAAAYKAEQAKAPAPRMQSNAGMVEQGTISRDEYMRTRGGIGFNGQPLAPQDYGTAPSAPPMTFVDEGTLGLQKGMRKGDIERFDPASLDRPMDTGARTKMPRSQSVALGVTDFNPIRLATGDRGFEKAMTQSLQDNPISTRGGQVAALTAGGGAQAFNAGTKIAPKLVSPLIAARVAGNSLRDQAIRYGGRLATLGTLGAADYAGYNILAEAPNQAREQGAPSPSLSQRIDFAAQEALTPAGALSAIVPGAGSLLYRTGRAGIAAGKNLATTGAARPALASGQSAPVSQLFTPADVQARVANLSPTLTTMKKTDAERAIDMLLRRGFDPDEAEKMVKFLDYAGKSEVPEMLFQIMPDLRSVDQLTVALGTVGGQAQKALADALGAQATEAPGVLREALRKAMGISGEDYYAMQKGLRAEQLSAPKAGYEAAYGKQVTDETWENQVLPLFQNSPSAKTAIREAAGYAADVDELGVARELAELADTLGRQGSRPAKVSTQALDYIDRMLGDAAQGIRQGSGRQELARGPAGAQQRLRGDANAGLDAETGLGAPRRLSAELKTAQEALEFGRKAFRQNVDIENLQDEFASAIAKLGQDGTDSETISGALLMGWLRGAEDEISTATNPSSVIRRIYGSERQRQKLLAMMPQVDEAAGAGTKGSNTKNIRALVGGKREDGREMQGMIDRLRRMSGDYNRIIGNSQSAQRLEAVAEQGGAQDKLNFVFDAFLNTRQAAVNVARMAVNRVSRPGIYEPGVNRELGRILTARGKKQLLSVIDEIRQRQLARSGGTPPAPAVPPRPPTPPRGGGGAPAAATQDDGFAQARQAGKVTPEERAMLLGNDDIKAGGFAFRPRQTKAEPFNDPRLTPSENKAVEMRRNGLTVREMADEMDTSEDAVYKFIQTAKAKGVDVGEQGKDRVRDSILDLASKGIPQSAIAQRLGISANNVKVILANARKAAGDDMPDWLRPRALAGGMAPALRTDLGNAAGGAFGGAVFPIPSTGDFNEDMRNRAGAVFGGAALGFGARRFAGSGASARGQGMASPKTPQQAMRAELPGSPEYEAAVAKGLDMSTPARMQRAKEMGFDTDKVYYHGTDKNFDAFDPKKGTDGLGIHVGTADQANNIDTVRTTGSLLGVDGAVKYSQNSQILPVVTRARNPIRLPDLEDWEPSRVAWQLRKRGIDIEGPNTPENIVKALQKAGHDSIVYQNTFEGAGGDSLIIFDPSNIRSVHAAFDPDKAASPILTAGLGGGGKRPRKDSPEAILKGVQKITAQLKATGTQAATPQQPEMRIGKGLAKMSGIADNRELGAKAARDMMAAGRSPAEIFTATNHVPMTVDGKTIMIRAAGKSPDEVTAAFWQEMAKPVSRRAEWIREQTRSIKPIGPDAVARQPLETRTQVVTSMIRKGGPIKPQAIWEETDIVVIMRGRDGQPVISKYSVPDGSEPVSLMDGANFKSFDDVIDYLRTVEKLPRAEQPAWYRENFSDPLTLDRPASRLQRAGDFAQRRQNTVGAILVGGTVLGGTAGVLTANDTPESVRIKLDEPPQRQNRR